MNKFRASYSVLSTWNSGQWDRAVKMYFKLDTFKTEAMADGQEFHELWKAETDKTKCLPEIFGGKELIDPKTELKLVVPIEEWLDLVGVIDCIDGNTIYEYKSGKTSSEVYANGVQPGIYGVLATYGGMFVDRCEIMHYDQYTKKLDTSIIHLTDKLLDDTHNWILSISSEMQSYLLDNNLYKILGKQNER
jgi:hypothetical protein